MVVYCASTNPGKLREFNLIAAHYGGGQIEVLALPGLKEIEAPAETGATFAENASLKAAFYSRFADGLVFADDSGLAVDALGGAPGIFSARFAGEHASDAENNAKLLAELTGVADRAGRFVCAIAVARNGQTIAGFEDSVAGEILTAAAGANGFGYDPLFFYPPFATSFGEVPAEQKLLVSHRGKAMGKMIRWMLVQAQS